MSKEDDSQPAEEVPLSKEDDSQPAEEGPWETGHGFKVRKVEANATECVGGLSDCDSRNKEVGSQVENIVSWGSFRVFSAITERMNVVVGFSVDAHADARITF